MPVNPELAQEQWNRFVYCRDNGHLSFIDKADKCEKFFRGEQWETEDLHLLAQQKRPAMTINKIISTVGTILGEQIYNRTEVLFRPTAGAPAEVAEALSKVWMQVSQNNQLPWVRSDVFCDGVVRSRGFYDVRLNFNDSMEGEIAVDILNSKNVVIDCDAEEYDPDKWSDVFITKWMNGQDIAILYNEEDAKYLAERDGGNYGYDSIERYQDNFGGGNNVAHGDLMNKDRSQRNVRVLERQYRKLDKQLHFVDIETGDMRPIPAGWGRDKIAALLEKTGGRIGTTKKLVKRIRWCVTADNVVLHDEWGPYQHFTVVPYFPYFRYGHTVGIVENLLGPQEILNKVSSQELHIVNTTANSGWIVEEDSLLNMSVEELEANGATTGLVLEFKKGAQPPGKIQPNQTPTGLDRISYKAEEHIKSVSNVSDSMQGFDRGDVAAKAIAYKQQRGSINMTKILDNLERTDWILARNCLALIQEFYTEERIINITHDDLTREPEEMKINAADPVTGAITNDLTLGEYDIIVTSSPYRASLEDSQFEQARALREIGVNIPDSVLIENSRLQRRADILKDMQAQNADPMVQAMKELDLRARTAEVAQIEADTQLKQAKATKEMADAQPQQGQTSPLEAGKVVFDMEQERKRLDAEIEEKVRALELKYTELDHKFALKTRELDLKEQEVAENARTREQEAAQSRLDALRRPSEKEITSD